MVKSIKNKYHLVHNYQALMRSHYRCRKGKRDTPEVVEFETYLNSNIAYLQEEVKYKTYRVGEYKAFIERFPKKRLIMYLPYRDRIVQNTLSKEVIEPLIKPLLIYDNYASQEGKGTHMGIKRFEGFLRGFYNKNGCEGYVLKADISKYFPSINHEVLKGNLYPRIGDSDIKWLLNQYIDSTNSNYVQKILLNNYKDLGLPHPKIGKGITIGNVTSQDFAVFHLNKLDWFAKEELGIKYYSRYMDDFVLIHKDKEYLQYCLIEIEKLLTSLDLKLNPKTQIFPLKNGVDYLGWHFYLTETGRIVKRLRVDSKKRVKRKVKYFKKAYETNDVDISSIKQSISSWEGHAKHGNTYNLRNHVLAPIREILL